MNLGPEPRFTIILKVKDYPYFQLENFTLRKTIFKLYSESHFLHDPDENIHGVVSRKTYHLVFAFAFKFFLAHKILDLKVEVVLKFTLTLKR